MSILVALNRQLKLWNTTISFFSTLSQWMNASTDAFCSFSMRFIVQTYLLKNAYIVPVQNCVTFRNCCLYTFFFSSFFFLLYSSECRMDSAWKYATVVDAWLPKRKVRSVSRNTRSRRRIEHPCYVERRQRYRTLKKNTQTSTTDNDVTPHQQQQGRSITVNYYELPIYLLDDCRFVKVC